MGVEQLALVNQAGRAGALGAMLTVLVDELPESMFDWVIGESASFLRRPGRPGASTAEATASFLATSDGRGLLDRLKQLMLGEFESSFEQTLAHALAARVDRECGPADIASTMEPQARQAL